MAPVSVPVAPLRRDRGRRHFAGLLPWSTGQAFSVGRVEPEQRDVPGGAELRGGGGVCTERHGARFLQRLSLSRLLAACSASWATSSGPAPWPAPRLPTILPAGASDATGSSSPRARSKGGGPASLGRPPPAKIGDRTPTYYLAAPERTRRAVRAANRGGAAPMRQPSPRAG